MNILVVADYPRPKQQSSGVFNERSVKELRRFCRTIEVVAHHPYFPRLLSAFPIVSRWKTYADIKKFEVRDGISIYRPAYLQIPCMAAAFWLDRGAFFWCRRIVRELHRRARFDAIMSFDLLTAGGLAWRLGHDLGIPASGWACGSDVRCPPGTYGWNVVLQAIKHLDLVFYQSHELLEIAANLLGVDSATMPEERHVVLPRGIPEPPSLCRTAVRRRVRLALGIRDDEILVLNVGSIEREKGVFDLLKAISLAIFHDSRIRCVLLGSRPDFDETNAVQKAVERSPTLQNRVTILPACVPDRVWEYICAADIFAFASHNEGMPNSLLEAMAMGLPALAFGIPPIVEIDGGTGCLIIIPPFSSVQLSEAILRLVTFRDDRARLGERGKREVMERFMVQKNMAEAARRIAQLVAIHKSKVRDRALLSETGTSIVRQSP